NEQAVIQAADQIAQAWRNDVAALLQWAQKTGHHLGHLTSLRSGLLASGIPVVEEFKRLSFALPDGERTKRLNQLLDDVRKGEQAADARWYQEFRQEAGGADLQISFPQLSVVLRAHQLFDVVNTARKGFLAFAEETTRIALEEAKRAAPVTRL